MPASPEEIRDAVGEFIALIEDSAISAEERMQRLRRSLDHLALLQHDVRYISEERESPEPPDRNYDEMRRIVSAHFPELGYYNIPSSLPQHIADTDLEIGDAIDDITDIALELYEVLWRFDHASANDALWYFEFSYSAHWEWHLRGLQFCLQHLSAGHEDTI
jgi:Domain of unknown function (DUF5063)